MDRKCFICVFRLPSSWKPFMTFVQPVDGSVVGKKPGTEVYVASATVVMGWISATGVCQHLHRNMLRTGCAGSAGLSAEGEWSLGRCSRFKAKVCDARARLPRQP